ncbi:hypothetical protein B0H11DRAFT_2334019 [Mycena galericulata]|nr:hypothetical protein B0H11DRAFT_2334019 [Mycena galericulata]
MASESLSTADISAAVAALADMKAGPIRNLRRADLIVIATSLGIPISSSGPNKQNVNEIKIILNKAMEDPSLAFAEAYQKFLVYPRGNPAAPKTSAEKAKQDTSEAKSQVVPAAGANKKLFEAGTKTDPPPQYKQLGDKGKARKEDSESDSGDEKSSVLSSFLEGSEQSDIEEPESPSPHMGNGSGQNLDGNGGNSGKNHSLHNAGDHIQSPGNGNFSPEATNDLPVIVKFGGTDPREIWLPRDRISVIETEDDAGTSYHTSLKQLLPVAVKELIELSPVKKDARGKIGVKGRATGGRVNLGTVAQFVSGDLPSILDLRIDNYKLERIPDGLLCDIFYEEGTQPTGNLEGPESKPLEVARERAEINQAVTDKPEDPLIPFLRRILEGPKTKPPTAKTIGVMVARYHSYNKAEAWMKDNWADGANFRVPHDYDSDFRGRAFKTEHIQLAMRLKHTTHYNDDLIFRESRLRDDPSGEAVEWVEKPEKERLKKKFAGMSRSEWNTYLDKAKADEEIRRKDEEKKKKRKREREEKDDRKKNKGRDGEQRMDSKRHRRDTTPVAGPSHHKGSSRNSNGIDHESD